MRHKMDAVAEAFKEQMDAINAVWEAARKCRKRIRSHRNPKCLLELVEAIKRLEAVERPE